MAPAAAANILSGQLATSLIVAPAAATNILSGQLATSLIVAPAAATNILSRRGGSKCKELKQGDGDEFKHGVENLK
jgi:hypothetical protein